MHPGRGCGGVWLTPFAAACGRRSALSPACFPVQPPGLNNPQAAARFVRTVCPDYWPHGAAYLAAFCKSMHLLLRYSQLRKYTIDGSCSGCKRRPMTFACKAASCCGTACRLMPPCRGSWAHTALLGNTQAVPRVSGLFSCHKAALLCSTRSCGMGMNVAW